MNKIETQKNPILMWNDFVHIDDNATEQLKQLADSPAVHGRVCAMPDTHWGMGATVGSVFATKSALIPAAVGVDIGCGMMAKQLSITADELPDNLKEIRLDIEKSVPTGFGRGKQWHNVPDNVASVWNDEFKSGWEEISSVNDKVLNRGATAEQLGTLGSGNHFIEICLDEKDNAWVMLHSGSRGLGNRLGQYYIAAAKELMARYYISLKDSNLSYIPKDEPLFDEYWTALQFAQRFAKRNRELMMENVLSILKKYLPEFTVNTMNAVNCHHNYANLENHGNENVIVTRKGAVSARRGELGIIPGDMGNCSFLVEGLGNAASYHSCSHGAGRVMSRTEAKKTISVEDHIKATEGVECVKDKSILDESPAAYKDIDDVMKSQQDLVSIVHTLKQVVNVKGL